jgi:hypothetical protein
MTSQSVSSLRQKNFLRTFEAPSMIERCNMQNTVTIGLGRTNDEHLFELCVMSAALAGYRSGNATAAGDRGCRWSADIDGPDTAPTAAHV